MFSEGGFGGGGGGASEHNQVYVYFIVKLLRISETVS